MTDFYNGNNNLKATYANLLSDQFCFKKAAELTGDGSYNWDAVLCSKKVLLSASAIRLFTVTDCSETYTGITPVKGRSLLWSITLQEITSRLWASSYNHTMQGTAYVCVWLIRFCFLLLLSPT